MRRLVFGDDHVALVDNIDLTRLLKIKWYWRHETAYTSVYADGKQRHVPLSHFVIDVPPGMYVLHKDRDKLNNQRDNLIIATRSEWRRTSSRVIKDHIDKYGTRKSGYKGVSPYGTKWWVARICIGGKVKSLGYYLDEVTAARSYDRAARKHLGDMAFINFPDLPPLTDLVGYRRPDGPDSPFRRSDGTPKRTKKARGVPGATRRPPPDEDSDFDDDDNFF